MLVRVAVLPCDGFRAAFLAARGRLRGEVLISGGEDADLEIHSGAGVEGGDRPRDANL
jgi:hypothetical protein